MKTTLNTLSAAVAGACLIAATGLASAQGTAGQSPATPGSGAPGTTMPGATAPATPNTMAPGGGAMQGAAPMQQLQLVRLSKLDGIDIRDGNNKKVGEIDEIVVDPRSGDIRQVIVSSGGVVGIGESKHAIGIGDLRFQGDPDRATGRLHATTTMAPDQMPKVAKADRNSGVKDADDLIGTDVLDAQGKEIGEIEDIVVDVRTGRAQYVLLEFDKAWSLDDKLFAFPMSEFRPVQKDDKLMLDIRKERLEGMASLSKRDLDRADLSSVMPRSTGAAGATGATGGGASGTMQPMQPQPAR